MSHVHRAAKRSPGQRKPGIATGAAVLRYLAVMSLLTIAIFALFGCKGVHFLETGAGYYPAGATYADYDYEAVLYTETSDSGSMYDLQDKAVWIRVEDQAGKRFLNDKIEVRACMVEGTAVWSPFEDLAVELVEVGYERQGAEASRNDPYSVALARSGPRTIATLRYHYNEEKKRFEKVE